jgi:predicted aconitase with swiveling domain
LKEKRVIRGRRIVPGKASGKAMVSETSLCFRSEFDPATGKVIDMQHPLYDRNLSGRVLVMPSGTGSSGNTMHVRVAGLEGTAPAALINLEADPPSVLGCVIAGIPVIQVEPADLSWIADGDWVEVDSDRETVRVYEPQ